MRVGKKEARLLQTAIHQWTDQGLLNEEASRKISDDIEIIPFDWKKLARYSFWISLVCIIISVGAALSDRTLMKLIESVFSAPYFVKCISLSLIAAGLYWLGMTRRSRFPDKIFSNESILFLGVVMTAGAVYQLGRALDMGDGHFSVLLLLSSLIYGALGFWFKSSLVWLF